MGIILALIIFSFIVFFHELGHFTLAKKNGITVEEFSIGMGPRLLTTVKKGTRYSIKLLPIGGSCIMGEDDADDMSDGSFNSKSVWQRIAVIAGGPVFNFILAFVFAMILLAWTGIDKPIVGTLSEGFPAVDAGIQPGDKIVQMNEKKIHIFREISTYNQFHQGETVKVTYERDGKQDSVTIKPKLDEDGAYRLGMGLSGNVKGNALEIIGYGAYEVKFWISSTLESLKMLVTGSIGADQLSGPVGIVDVVDNQYQQSRSSGIAVVILSMINIAIFLSANLGVMNLLPLPALDGGRLVFLVIEAVRGKRVPPEKEGMVHLAGLVLLFGLMIFVMFNDVRRIFF